MKKSVVILEDDSLRLAEMRKCLAELLPRFQHLYFDDAFKMIAWLEDHLAEVVLISLDHDLPTDTDHGTGRLVADYLAEKPPICPVIVHTSNEFLSPGMMQVLSDSGWPLARVYPHSNHNWVRKGWAEQINLFKKSGWIFS